MIRRNRNAAGRFTAIILSVMLIVFIPIKYVTDRAVQAQEYSLSAYIGSYAEQICRSGRVTSDMHRRVTALLQLTGAEYRLELVVSRRKQHAGTMSDIVTWELTNEMLAKEEVSLVPGDAISVTLELTELSAPERLSEALINLPQVSYYTAGGIVLP